MKNKEIIKCLERMLKSDKTATKKQSLAVAQLIRRYNEVAPESEQNAFFCCISTGDGAVYVDLHGKKGSMLNMLISVMSKEYTLLKEAITAYESISTEDKE